MAISEIPTVGVKRVLWHQLNSGSHSAAKTSTLQIEIQSIELQGVY
jgi:hypothetical protein